MSQTDPPSFLNELKRRKTVRVAMIYLAGAYALLSVAELLLEPLGAPPWVFRALIIVAALGLPAAVVLAWAFDFTPQGLRRTGTESESSGTEVSWLSARTVIAVLALVVVSATAGWLVGGSGAVSNEDVDNRSIAVLPFDDFSSGSDQEWFAAGMQEALITALQQIGALRVTSRTSAMLYKETRRSSREIAGELRTRWLVEGSVVRDGDRIRISAQLIDGPRDEHLWAEQYERDVEDILALQNDVARAIAAEIDVALTPAEARRLAAAPRVEPEMYGAYVLGLHHLYRITPDDFLKSISYFKEAIALDSTFAPAHAALAVSYATGIEYDWISKEEVGEAAA